MVLRKKGRVPFPRRPPLSPKAPNPWRDQSYLPAVSGRFTSRWQTLQRGFRCGVEIVEELPSPRCVLRFVCGWKADHEDRAASVADEYLSLALLGDESVRAYLNHVDLRICGGPERLCDVALLRAGGRRPVVCGPETGSNQPRVIGGLRQPHAAYCDLRLEGGVGNVISFGCGPEETTTMTVPKSLSQRIADDLREKIDAGELAAGEKIPSASELQATYGCSITPVRRAIDQLKTLGLVEGHSGMGVFVRARQG